MLERERADRFLRDDLRRRFVVAHAALRAILGRYLGIEPGDVQFCYGPKGKPQLAELRISDFGLRIPPAQSAFRNPHSAIRFNLAHSGELAVVAISRGGEIGVDVERLRPVPRREQLAERYFAPSESSAILSADESRRDAEFLATWTAKEAILKAIGAGLSFPLSRFAVSPTIGGQWVSLAQPPANCSAVWWLERVDVANGYVAAVAADSQKTLRPTLRYPEDLN